MARNSLVLLLFAISLAGAAGYALAPSGGEGEAPARASLIGSSRQAAQFAASEADYSNEPGSDGFFRAAALSTMNLVQTNISAPRYGALAEEGEAPADLSEVWAKHAGICQNASDAYTSVMDELGIKTRRLEIYWLDPEGGANSHATVETRWDGQWHWLDPTYGALYTPPGDPTDVLSFEEVRSAMPKQLRLNQTDEWWMQNQVDGPLNVIGFVEWPDRKVLWFPVKRPSAAIPGEVDGLERLSAAEWRAPHPASDR